MIEWYTRWYRVCALLVVIGTVAGSYGIVQAEDANSSHYKVTDTQFGSGSVSDCSSHYCANGTAGDLTVGAGKSANYQAEFGSDTQDQPLLEVIDNGGNMNFGTLTTTATASTYMNLEVRAYEISGYTIQISGSPPSQGTHTLHAPSTPTTSQPGTEQFGMNLVANTTPSVGANPNQVPDSTFSFGQAATGYDTANEFKYADGDVIASSSKSTGETDYTVSLILNISDVTPAGQYTGSYNAVVVPVY